MPRRIVIHAGFHKTGTSTVQDVLRRNRPALRPYLQSVLRPALREVVSAARGYSTWRDPLTLARFRHRFETALATRTGMPRRTLCLSAEELAGHLPGRDALADYSAAPDLAAEMAAAAAQVMPDVPLVFYYSVRQPARWLRSAYWEHVKSSSLTLDFPEFEARNAGAADLPAILRRIEGTVPGPVHVAALEDQADAPAGPATPLLDLCDVPHDVQRDLKVAAANRMPDQPTLLALLEANRTFTKRSQRSAAKAAILARHAEAGNG